MNEQILALKATLEDCFTVQNSAVRLWHEEGREQAGFEELVKSGGLLEEAGHGRDPDRVASQSPFPSGRGSDGKALASLRNLVLTEHICNFVLWHLNDALAEGIGPNAGPNSSSDAFAANSLRRIKALNLTRSELIEKIDLELIDLLTPHLPGVSSTPGTTLGTLAPPTPSYSTESVGLALDRLSVITIKSYHMAEEADNPNVEPARSLRCEDMLLQIRERRDDLIKAILDLIDEYVKGRRVLKFYRQFRVYAGDASYVLAHVNPKFVC